jgi:hypothetical protein
MGEGAASSGAETAEIAWREKRRVKRFMLFLSIGGCEALSCKALRQKKEYKIN